MPEGDVDTLVLGAVNTCWRDPIDLPTLLGVLRSSQDPGQWRGPVRQLFTDVPLPALVRFAKRHQLSRQELGYYYARHIAYRRDVNPDVEAWLRG